MRYNTLGRTGIKVSEICLGTMTWGSQNSIAEAHEQLDYAFDKGVNFIDTYIRTGTYPRAVPYIPGAEGTGVVEQAGALGGDRASVRFERELVLR